MNNNEKDAKKKKRKRRKRNEKEEKEMKKKKKERMKRKKKRWQKGKQRKEVGGNLVSVEDEIQLADILETLVHWLNKDLKKRSLMKGS